MTHEKILKKELSSLDDLALVSRSQSGDKLATEVIVMRHKALVFSLVRKNFRDPSYYPDLFHEGILGLIKAIGRYDPKLVNPETGNPYKFISYAAWWIKEAIQKSRVTHEPCRLYVPINVRTQVVLNRSWNKKIRDDITEAAQIAMDHSRYMSLDSTIQNSDNDDSSVSDSIPDERNIVDEIEQSDSNARLKQCLLSMKLDDRERMILEKKLLSDNPVHLSDVGSTFGVTRERIRQIETQLLKRMKNRIEVQGLAPL